MSNPEDSAVIDILLDRIGHGFNKHSAPGHSEVALAAHEAKIQSVRDWASTLGWSDRRRYNRWLDVWQRGVDEYRHEQKTGEYKAYWAKQTARMRAEDEAAKLAKQAMPKPPKAI